MELLIVLTLVAGPIGMGLMMLFMAKGMGRGESQGQAQDDDRGSLAELQAQHARLAAEIERLEATDGAHEPAARRSREGG